MEVENVVDLIEELDKAFVGGGKVFIEKKDGTIATGVIQGLTHTSVKLRQQKDGILFDDIVGVLM